MEKRPPERIAKLVNMLLPPASREHVLGDLNERYGSPQQYLLDALRALPFVVASRLRRTTHPLGLILAGLFLWWAVFWGNRQQSWLAALIPTLITLTALALRDVYRDATPKWSRAVAIDIAIAAAGVLLSQAVLLLIDPTLLLTRDTLLVGFPLGFVILFAVRLQSPTGFYQPPGYARIVSMQELRIEITQFEVAVRRAVRVEMVACVFVAVCFFIMAVSAPAPAPDFGKIGAGFTSAAALFIWWFLYRFGRVRQIPANLEFTDSLAAYRGELERRLRFSKNYVWWYVMPLLIGMEMMTIGPQLQRPDSFPRVLFGVLILTTVGGILVLVQRGMAQKSQQRLEQLNHVSEKTPST